MATALDQLTFQTRCAARAVDEMLAHHSQLWEMPYLFAQRWVLIQSIVSSIHGDHPASIILGHVRFLLWEFAQVLERAPQREGVPDQQDCQATGFEARSDATFGPSWVHRLTQNGAPPEQAIANLRGEGWIYVPSTPGTTSTRPTLAPFSRTRGGPQQGEDAIPGRSTRPRSEPYPAGPAAPRPRYGQSTNIGPLPREGPRIEPAGFHRCLAAAHRIMLEHAGTLALHSPDWARWQTLAQIARILSISNGEVEHMVYTIQQAVWGHTYLLEHLLSERACHESHENMSPRLPAPNYTQRCNPGRP